MLKKRVVTADRQTHTYLNRTVYQDRGAANKSLMPVQDRDVGLRKETNVDAILSERCKLPMGQLKTGNGKNSGAQAGDMNSQQGPGKTLITSNTLQSADSVWAESNWDRLRESEPSGLLSELLNLKESEVGLLVAILDAHPLEKGNSLRNSMRVPTEVNAGNESRDLSTGDSTPRGSV